MQVKIDAGDDARLSEQTRAMRAVIANAGANGIDEQCTLGPSLMLRKQMPRTAGRISRTRH